LARGRRRTRRRAPSAQQTRQRTSTTFLPTLLQDHRIFHHTLPASCQTGRARRAMPRPAAARAPPSAANSAYSRPRIRLA
jgi:hypothetical protein